MKTFFALCTAALALAGTSSLQAFSSAPIKLNSFTNPSAGQAGTSTVYLTGSGFTSSPAPGSSVAISLASRCGGTAVATTTGTTVTNVLGSTYRIGFVIPGTLTTANYFVSISGPGYLSSNCSEVAVQAPVKFSGACLPTSSLGVLVNQSAKTVTAYTPNGAWDEGTTGVQVVPLEPAPVGAAASIVTPNIVNSCSSNPTTGQTVCTGNNTDVYLISGATLNNTLTSGATATLGFSGGDCMNCGVAVNSATNQAAIALGNSGSNGGIQFLNLDTNVFGAVQPLATQESENIAWDTTRDIITSPSENGTFDLLKVGAGGTIQEFGNFIGGNPDSAAEDCTTGILLSTIEFSDNLFIGDLTQATFVPGTPGSWSAPGQVSSFPEFNNLEFGTNGISVPPGSHTAVVAGEFGGSVVGFIQLPASSGSGTPAFGDYVIATMPSTPDGCSFANGFDPHTVTAYTSPNNGKAYALLADWGTNTTPTYLAQVDIQGILGATRGSGTPHTVDPSVDLIAAGIVTYVPTGNANCGGGGNGPAVSAQKPATTNTPPPHH